jgi:hypothetical protein
MHYNIDRSLSSEGIYIFNYGNASYILKMKESAPGSGFWTIDFIKSSGDTKSSEVFKIMNIVANLCKEYADKTYINNVIMFISGEPEESSRKAKVFSRWIGDNWNCEIKTMLSIRIPGARKASIIPSHCAIIATRISNSKQEETIPTSIPTNTDIKFCFNCGTPNNSYQFCPNCGTKLKQ